MNLESESLEPVEWGNGGIFHPPSPWRRLCLDASLAQELRAKLLELGDRAGAGVRLRVRLGTLRLEAGELAVDALHLLGERSLEQIRLELRDRTNRTGATLAGAVGGAGGTDGSGLRCHAHSIDDPL